MKYQSIIARLPSNAARVGAYRLFGRDIGPGCRIGRRSYLSSRSCRLAAGTIIGPGCVIACHRFACGAGTHLFAGARFDGGGGATLGERVRIGYDHYFDCWGEIEIGSNTFIAGRHSQFWTHGSLRGRPTSIRVGSDCYVGSACIFLPGSGVADGCLVGAGSVLTRRFDEPDCCLAGNPARILRRDFRWREQWA